MFTKKIKLISILFFQVIFSQTLEITVLDLENMSPLQGANISLKKISKLNDSILGNSSDKRGKSYFNNIQLGSYELTVQFIGYKKNTLIINIEENRLYKFDILLITESLIGPELNIIGGANKSYKQTPGSAFVINENNMRQINPVGTQEILEHVAGIHAFSDDGIGNSRISIGIRGLNPRRSSRVLILEDGIPIQPALYVYPNMYYNPPVERLDGVQVIKGSGVVKFGPQTMGGVINYYTRRPGETFDGFVNTTVGENGYLSIFTELNGFKIKKTNNAFQLLYKRGDGFRDNNEFEQINTTYKTNYYINKSKNIYSKISLNYENSQATYTGLTEWSFENNPNFNPKEDDNFKVFRISADLIETTKINSNLMKTRKLYSSFFDRRWWRETDIFTSASYQDTIIDANDVSDTFYDDIIRIGNDETNFGILRTFYVLGYEQNYQFDYDFMNFNLNAEFGIRTYWERFIDDKVIGDSPDAREGRFYWEPEEGDVVYDLNGNDVYDEFFVHPEFNDIGDLCDTGIDGECDFTDANNDGLYNLSEVRVGQSHHYETAAISAYFKNSINVGKTLINGGFRLELFEQERIDLLDGATYLDHTNFVILPSISFISNLSNYENNSLSIFGGIHRGYTSPSSGALKVSNFALDTGLDLEAEKSWNKEIGIRSSGLFSMIDMELSYFHLDIENLVAAGRGTAFKNLGKVETMGTELSTRIFSNSSLWIPTLHFTQTYLKTNIISAVMDKYYFMGSGDPIDISGNELPYSPENSFLLGIEYNILEKIRIRFDYKYVGRVYTDFHNIDDTRLRGSWDDVGNIGIRGPIPEYSIINANISFKPSSKINIVITAKNLMDKIYIGSRLHSNPNQPQADISSGIIPGPRRQINLSVKFSLKNQ